MSNQIFRCCHNFILLLILLLLIQGYSCLGNICSGSCFFLSNYTCFCYGYIGVLNYISAPLVVNNLQKTVFYTIL